MCNEGSGLSARETWDAPSCAARFRAAYLSRMKPWLRCQRAAACGADRLYPVNVAESNVQVARECEFIILAIKPVYMRGVLEEMQKYSYNKKIISIAAGWSTAMLTEILRT